MWISNISDAPCRSLCNDTESKPQALLGAHALIQSQLKSVPLLGWKAKHKVTRLSIQPVGISR